MCCSKCNLKTKVADIVNTPDGEVYRRRRCPACGREYYTVEFVVEYDKTIRDIWRENHRTYRKLREKRDARL